MSVIRLLYGESCRVGVIILNKGESMKDKICDECKMSMMDHTYCMGCEEPMCENEDTIDMPEGWYHPDCHSDIYG